MAAEQDRVDVAHVMRRIREETRSAHHHEIEQRIQLAREQLEQQVPQIFQAQLRTFVLRLNEIFTRYYERMAAYLLEQQPNFVNVCQRTLPEINRLLSEPLAARGPRDRWWNPRSWMKWALRPLQRFVLRPHDHLIAVMRDAVVYLVNHSAHVETKRLELEIGVQMMHTMNALLEEIEAMRRYIHDWPRVSLAPMVGYLAEMQDRAYDRQVEETARLRDDFRRMHETAAERHAQEVGRLHGDFANRLDEARARQSQEMERLYGDFCRQLHSLTDGWGERMAAQARQTAAAATPTKAPAIVGFDNLEFARAMRGDPATIRQQQTRYVEYLRGQENVLDAGCGRGELLEQLRDAGISAYGVDLDERMVGECREEGLHVVCEDIVDHLAGMADDWLGGLVGIQLLEHLDFVRLWELLRLAGRKVRPGGVIVFETVNPGCLTTFSGAFYADPTHQRPIHPEGARQMLEMVGFGDVKIEFLNPIAGSDKLKPLTLDLSDATPELRQAVEALNENIERINAVLYGFADYAIIARRPNRT